MQVFFTVTRMLGRFLALFCLKSCKYCGFSFDRLRSYLYHSAHMSSAPSKHVLPRLIDPRKFAQQGLILNGTVPLAELSRLVEVASSSEADIDVSLQFDIDDQRHKLITGSAKGVLQVACQRCLNTVDVPLEATLNVAIVWDEDRAKQLPRYFDPLILGEGPADIYTVIEDELLLTMPMVSYHEHNCIETTSFGDQVSESEENLVKNPFQVLEQLKGSPKS